jgi:hypothetical protein
MQLSCNVNGVPISGKCSVCGAQMAQHSQHIGNPIETNEWFRDQFKLHVGQYHSNAAPRKSTFVRLNQKIEGFH